MNKETKDENLLKNIDSEVVKNKEAATTTISVVAPYELLKKREAKVFSKLAESLEVDGFRAGKVPQKVAEEKIPESHVRQQAGSDLISDIYLSLLKKHKVDGIGQPQISITKLAKDNPFEFNITLANSPEVKLGDYRSVAQSNQDDTDTINPEVSDEELEQSLKGLRQQWAQQQKYQKKVTALEDKSEASNIDPRQIEVSDDELPEVTKDWVSQLGPYESVADFKEKFRSNIKSQKAKQAMEQRQAKALSEVIEDSEFQIPELLFESEQQRLIEMRKAEVKQAGLKWHQYLTSIDKTEEELRSAMRETAEDRVKTQLVIIEIAKAENLEPRDSVVEKEVEFLESRYPEAEKPNLVAYATSQLTAHNVTKYLGGQQEESNKNAKADKKTGKDKKKDK